jgi:hypothetical protein
MKTFPSLTGELYPGSSLLVRRFPKRHAQKVRAGDSPFSGELGLALTFFCNSLRFFLLERNENQISDESWSR